MTYNLLTGKLMFLNIRVKIRPLTGLYTTKSTFNNIEKSNEFTDDKVEVPVNPLKKYYSANQQPNGETYDFKPFKTVCEEGKTYNWCLCGHSKHQPFCDGTHNNIFMKIQLKPIKFTVNKTKEYWLCNCKKTLNRPFCDGSHKLLEKAEYKYKKPKN